MLNNPFFKVLSLYLIIAVFALTLPAQGWAMLVPAGHPKHAQRTWRRSRQRLNRR